MKLRLRCVRHITLENYQEAYGEASWRACNIRPGEIVSGWQYDDDMTIDIEIKADDDRDYRVYTFTLDEDAIGSFEIIEDSE